MSMSIEEAIRILDPETSADAIEKLKTMTDEEIKRRVLL